MNKRIGILTFFYNNRNYGGLLQAYALQKSIQNRIENCDCKQISYNLSPTPLKSKIRNAINYSTPVDIFEMIFWDMSLKKIIETFPNKYVQRVIKSRLEAFKKFEDEIPHSKEVYNYQSIKNSVKEYDIYVVGSDQIWNAGIDLKTFLLSFAPDNIGKISYAASSGGIVFKGNQKKLLVDNLTCFDAISVREKSLEKQINELGNFSIKTVIDPVFLLEREEWEEVVQDTQIEEPYILCYLLGTSYRQRKMVEAVCSEKGYKLLVFPYITNNSFRLCDYKIGDIKDCNSGPKQFLGLIKNAEAVITDSFHAVAFSVIFNKTFCVLPRYQNGKESKSNNRILDFLDQMHIRGRVAESKEQIIEVLNNTIEYKQVNGYVDKWKTESEAWIMDALLKEK